MGRYKLLEGKHSTGSGAARKDFVKGDVVESEHPLDTMFVNKFKELSDDPADDEPKKKKKGKKEEPKEGAEAAQASLKEADEKKVAKEEKEDEDEGVESELGDDVSSDFANATKADLLVLKKGRDFFVAEKDDPDTNIAKKALDKAGVEKFLKKQLKG